MAKSWVSAAVALAASAGLAIAAGAPIKLGEPVEHPHAGVALAVPKGYEYRPLTQLYDVANAVVAEDGRPVQAVTLSAFPVARKGAADEFADAKMAELRRNLAIRHLKLLKKTPMSVGGLKGAARLMSYTFRGAKTLAAQVYCLRELEGAKTRICYVLTVECSQDRQARLLPTLGAVVKSVRLTTVRHPAVAPQGKLTGTVEHFGQGFSFRRPPGWYAALSEVGAETGQVDYLIGGLPMPSAHLLAATASGDAITAKACAKKCLAIAKAIAAKSKKASEVLSEGPVKLGKLPAYQFVLKQTDKKKPATPGGKMLATMLIVHRVACVVRKADDPPTEYTVVLTAPGADAKAAGDLMEMIASGFALIEVTTQPATRPAPATKRAPAAPAKRTPAKN